MKNSFIITMESACEALGVASDVTEEELLQALKRKHRAFGGVAEARNYLDECRLFILANREKIVDRPPIDPVVAAKKRELAEWHGTKETIHCQEGGGKIFHVTRFMNFKRGLTFVDNPQLPDQSPTFVGIESEYEQEEKPPEPLTIVKPSHEYWDRIGELFPEFKDSECGCPHCDRTSQLSCSCGATMCWNPKDDGDIVCPSCGGHLLKRNQSVVETRDFARVSNDTEHGKPWSVHGFKTKSLSAPRKLLPRMIRRIERK